MPHPGAVLAAGFLKACAERDRQPDTRLRLLGWTNEAVAPTAVPTEPGDLGRFHEELVLGVDRARRGAWYTPAWLAEQLVETTVSRIGVVSDPACGGGAFLLAAADRLVALGASPSEVVADLLWGADIDPIAVAVTEASLWWWSADASEATVAGDRLVVADSLIDVSIPRSSAVVGNPPFLGQLKTKTASDDRRRELLRDRWGDAVRPYTDMAWIFLLAGVDSLEPGGTATLIQPQSVLAARDASAVRAAIDEMAQIERCWLDDGAAFAAAVHVCAPSLRRRSDGPSGKRAAVPIANDWTAWVSETRAVPPAHLSGERTVGDIATVAAGFRDEYYGLVEATSEATTGAGPGRRLVTVGSIDPFRVLDRPVRFAKRRWQDPRVDIDEVSNDRARRWVELQRTPKLVVATQTRVLEAAVDVDGSWVASVPAVVVVPHRSDDLWRLAAALHAPVVSAWMMRRTTGTALTADALKPTAGAISEVPLPIDEIAWDEAAEAAKDLAIRGGDWKTFARLADAAYGVTDEAAAAWWLERLPVR